MSEDIRLRLIIEGDIQGVGYRALVKYTARNLKIRGFVRNLPDGTVEIFCKGDKKSIDTFKEKINIRTENGGLFSINVKNIEGFEIKKFPEGLKTFDVKYEEDEAKTSFEKTNLERLEIGSLVLTDFRNDTNQNFKELGSKTDRLREGINQNFVTTENKYGDIHRQMVKMESAVSKITGEFVKSNQTNAKLVETLITKLDKLIK